MTYLELYADLLVNKLLGRCKAEVLVVTAPPIWRAVSFANRVPDSCLWVCYTWLMSLGIWSVCKATQAMWGNVYAVVTQLEGGRLKVYICI